MQKLHLSHRRLWSFSSTASPILRRASLRDSPRGSNFTHFFRFFLREALACLRLLFFFFDFALP